MGRRQRLKQGEPDPLGRESKNKGKKRKVTDGVTPIDIQTNSKRSKREGQPKIKYEGKGKGKSLPQNELDDAEMDGGAWGGIGGKDLREELETHTKFEFEDDDEGDIGHFGGEDVLEAQSDKDEPSLDRGRVHDIPFSDDDETSDSSANEGANDDDFLKNARLGSDSEDEPVTAKNIERKSRALDRRAAREVELDAEEVGAVTAEPGDAPEGLSFMELPDPPADGEEDDQENELPVQELIKRIHDCVKVLGDFKRLAAKGRARSEYVDLLLKDTAKYYGYNTYLTEKLFHLFSPHEAVEFFEANEVPRPVTIRANTIRTRRRDLAQALINRGVTLEPLGKWTNVGLQVFESTVPIGATPEYLAGHYMLQAASSFLPVVALAPQPDERVLDMASAPGGKATYISALMRNTGVVFANDANKARTKSLTANVHRLGCKNVVVCSYDGREFPRVVGGFDRVLLDSPCSGTGVISKDPSVKVTKSEKDFQLLGQLQRQLILCAIDSVNPDSKDGGYVVYSTCSVTVDENEAVVDYALRKRPNVELVETGIGFGVDGFQTYREKKFGDRMKLTKRYYPHVHNMDGFFVAKLKVNKLAKRKKAEDDQAMEDVQKTGEQLVHAFTFDNAADDEIIQENKRKHILKSKGIKIRPKLNEGAPEFAAAVTAH